MRNLSLGAGLVVRQLLFLTLMVFMARRPMSASFIARPHGGHEPGWPRSGLAVLALAHDAANSLAIELAIGTVFSALLILCVSVPTMNATISAPIKLIARQMVDLAAGDTEIDVHETDRTDEIATYLARWPSAGRGARQQHAHRRNQGARRPRGAAAARGGDPREVEHYSVDLSAATAKLGDMNPAHGGLLRA